MGGLGVMNRHWLDWSRSCVEQASEWMLDHAAADESPSRGLIDLSGAVCVVPGRRAARLLQAELLKAAQRRCVRIIPPRVSTPGALASMLLPHERARATELERRFAWTEALRRARGELGALLPAPPKGEEFLAWHALASHLAAIHAELAGEGVTFADVAARVRLFDAPGEEDRWRAIERAHAAYTGILAEIGLTCPHDRALPESIAPRENACRIIIVGVVELNARQRQIVERFAGSRDVLVHAPPRLADRFDEFGCVVPEAWARCTIDLDDEQIIVADRPSDQAQAVLREIAALGGRRAASDITIGLGDESLAPALEQAAEWAGLAVHAASGRTLGDAPPARALDALADFLATRSFASLAALLRHPDIERWVRANAAGPAAVSDWLALLDRYFTDHLHCKLTGEWLGDERRQRRLANVHDALLRLAQPLLRDEPLPIGDWVQPTLDVLAMLYDEPDARASTDRRREECLAIRDHLAGLATIHPALQPRLRADSAMRLLLEHLASEEAAPPAREEAIEMLGWLELHFDPAPVLAVAGFNEGCIPRSLAADSFLPDSLRRALRLTCNERRYARDAYLLEAIRHSRPHLRLIAGRRSAQGEPLAPSRFTFACDRERIVDRIERACDDRDQRVRASAGVIGLRAAADRSKFIVPTLPANLPAREFMRITEFRAYLACPYRYALAHVLGLESTDDEALELDPLRFGSLAHDVLCAFGTDGDISSSTDAEPIESFLLAKLRSMVRERFGSSPLPAVLVQAARLEQRLRSFAQVQAGFARDGWLIRHCEIASRTVVLDVPNDVPMPLHGKIDRIDQNERSGAWRVIDYKTGEAADSPHKSHHGCERIPADGELAWKDLQLPLYHYLVTRGELALTGPIELCYICLPRQADGCCLRPAEWSEAHLEHGVETARQVVRAIRGRSFDINPDFEGRFDEFARICQTSAFAEIEAEASEMESEVQP